MKKITKGLMFGAVAAMSAMSLAACSGGGGSETTTTAGGDTTTASQDTSKKEMKVAISFANDSLDCHKESYGWYTQIEGMSETLFRVDDDSNIVPLLAESAENEGTVWTIKINDKAAFSNGTKLTAEMVAKNLQRVGAESGKFKQYADFEIKAVDDKTLTIDTKDPYPTLKNELSSPEMGIMDLDATTDFVNAPIFTGPFVIDKFTPGGDVSVKKNENYWGGDVVLDKIDFLYMMDDSSKLMAMQNGEIDWYNSVSADAIAIYSKEPDKYTLTSIPGERSQFYMLNENNISINVRKAINSIVDKEAIAKFLEGSTSAVDGPFNPSAAYGKVGSPAKVDLEAAKKLMEDDGYTLNGNGIYEKDGKEVNFVVKYYEARELDKVATLMQEQLKAAGINTTLKAEEDTEGYITTGDYDIALYCMITDKFGDPYYFINNTLADGGYYNAGGFKNEECQKLIDQLKKEEDVSKRADLANQIIQIAVDDAYMGYVGLFNKTTVAKPEVKGISANNPYDFYGVYYNTSF